MIVYNSIQLTTTSRLDICSESIVRNKFDVVTILFREMHSKQRIFDDVIQEAVTPLYNGLTKCKANKMTLNSNLKVGRLGEAWNIWTYNLSDEVEEDEEDIFQQYWIWSIREFQTWLYSMDGKSYIEISPSYKWHYVQPVEGEAFTSFDEFTKQYQPVVIELSLEQVDNILKLLEQIKSDLNII
ncbi:hypothetical protein ABD76_22050 [Paenibacillus dendritiformis]|uniref:hypothetical protein n=1 Tax=Paenibacillus dendritiformis TaxID=130049 RepID=UPI0018CD8E78|nr:hypothetical protein [Paenibacillus dendritiformis]MBG9795003.1 hypothetical protein [Paenibacillus dendritiformis]